VPRPASLLDVPALTTDLDLAGMRLAPGEGRRIELAVAIPAIELAAQRYLADPQPIVVTLEYSRMVGHGYALRLSFQAGLQGPCMRCLSAAAPTIDVEAREVDRPGGGEELQSPYITDEILDLAAWARDALVLAMPAQVLCRPDCAGLCPQCAADLNDLGAEHRHELPTDPRWSKLSELEL
jgi:uncharacterized protein